MTDGYADGSIIVNTEVDAEGFEAGSKKLLTAIQGLTNQIKILGDVITESFSGKTVTAVSESNEQLDDYMQKVEELEQQLAQLQQTGEQTSAKINFGTSTRSGSDLEKQIKSVNSLVEKMEPVYEKAMTGSASAMSTLSNATQTAQAKIAELKAQMAEAGNVEIPTEHYEWLEQQISKLENTLRRYSDYEEQLKATGVKTHSKAWQALQHKIQLTESQLVTYQQELSQERSNATLTKDTDEFKALAASIQVAENQLTSWTANTQALQPFNEQFSNIRGRAEALQVSIAKANDEIVKLTARQDKMKALGVDEQSAAWKSVAYDIEQAQAKLYKYQETAEALKTELDGVQVPNAVPDSEAYRTASTAVKDLTAKLDALAVSAQNGAESVTENADQSTAAFSWMSSSAGQVVNSLKNIGKVTVSVFTKVVKWIGKAISKFLSMNKSIGGNNKSLTSLVKRFTSLGTMLKRMVLRKLISAIISAVKEGIDNLALFSDELNSNLSELLSSLTRLKNSFATALAPVLNVVTPILTALIDKLSDALTYIGEFIAALSGKTTYTKAIAVQEDYAEALDGTASSAENAKNALAGFDNLNNVTTSDDSDVMFEEVEIDSSILDFVEALKNGDISDTINSIVNAINNGLKTLNGAIDWDNAGEKINSVVSVITSAVNALADIDWALLGETVGTGLNTVINTIETFINKLNISSIGTSIADYFNGVFSSIDWAAIGETITSGLREVLSAIDSFTDTLDWDEIGESIGEALSSINWLELLTSSVDIGQDFVLELVSLLISAINETDWKEIGSALMGALNAIDWVNIVGSFTLSASTVIQGILELLIGALENADFSTFARTLIAAIVTGLTNINFSSIEADLAEFSGAFAAALLKALGAVFIDLPRAIMEWLVNGIIGIVDTFSESIEECGGNVALGILKGIGNIFVNIGTWIYDNMVAPFINGFKSLFGINSPSTVMEELGEYLVEGLLNGITNIWNSIVNFFSNAWSGIKSIFTNAWSSIKSTASTVSSSIKSTVSSAWNSIKSTTSNVWSSVKSVFSSAWSGIKSTASSAVSSVKSSVSSVWSNIKSTTSSTWNSVKSSISSAWSSITSTASSKLSSLKSTISSAFSSVVSSAKTWGSDICSNIASGITSAISKVTEAVSSVASKIKSWLGFSEPEEGPLSDFHTYMPDMLDLMAEGIYDNTPVAIKAVSSLAEAVSDELQSGDNTLAINTETAAANGIDGVLTSFADKVTNSFANLVSKLQAIAEGVTFATPLAANIIPYGVTGGGSSTGIPGASAGGFDGNKILEAVQAIQSKLDGVIQAIKDKETGITDSDIYSSVKRSVRSEQKSTGRTSF